MRNFLRILVMAAVGMVADFSDVFAQVKDEIHLKPKSILSGDPFYQVDTIIVRTRKIRSGRPSEKTLRELHQQFSEEMATGPFPWNEQSEDPMSIAELALKVWDIIQDNKAVLNVSTVNVKALPNLAKDHWEALTGWKPEHGVEYSLEIKNLYGITVVDLNYEVRLIYGGSVKGAGRYIASARVVPKSVNVLWGFNLDVSIQEVAVQNLRTEANPFASIVLEVGMNYGSIMKRTSETMTYRLNADGEIHDLTTGNVFFKK
jgi:hypothetical protein